VSEVGWAELREVSATVLAVNAHRSVREVLRTIVVSARRLLDARYAALGVPDDQGRFGEFLAEGISDEQWRAIGPVPRQHGVLGVLLTDPNPVRLDDIHDHPRFGGWWPAAHPEMTDFLGMPITDGDEILGELFLANKNAPGGFTADDEDLLRLLAAHAAIALVNARLHERDRELSIVEERNRISRELHDAVSQKLFSLRLTADAAGALLAERPERAAAELDTVRRLAAEVAEELHAIVDGLRPPALVGDGLDVALRKQIELLDRVHEAEVRFVGGPIPRLTEGCEQTAYRIAQEALHNALRHAKADLIEVDLTCRDGVVLLTVSDNGVGFDAADRAHAARRLGLASMRERARLSGGSLTVTSRPEGGTLVRLEVPVHE
jgi:signal transduction histidine kinase